MGSAKCGKKHTERQQERKRINGQIIIVAIVISCLTPCLTNLPHNVLGPQFAMSVVEAPGKGKEKKRKRKGICKEGRKCPALQQGRVREAILGILLSCLVVHHALPHQASRASTILLTQSPPGLVPFVPDFWKSMWILLRVCCAEFARPHLASNQKSSGRRPPRGMTQSGPRRCASSPKKL